LVACSAEEGSHLMHDEPSNADRGGRAVAPGRARTPVWYLLLVVPMIGTLIPPIYNTKDPTLIGIPFFYWYLILWVPVTVVCMLIVYRLTRGER
jgi:Protein of unknown function (DUF3311)